MTNVLSVALAGYLAFGQVAQNGRDIERFGGLQAIHADGAVTLRLNEVARDSRVADGGAHTLVTYRDADYPFTVVKHVVSFVDCAAVETWLEIRHDEPGPVRLIRMDSLAAELPGVPETARVLSLSGAWGREANVGESEVAPGQMTVLSARSGTRDAWESNAAMMISLTKDADERTGEVLGIALEWTGTNVRCVRRTWDGRVQVRAGAENTTGPYTLDPGRTLTLPRAILVHSRRGKGEVSRQFHRWARLHLMPHGKDLHPVLLNSWEGSYFSFTERTLTDMMDGVVEMGGEMFVLDDGWFGRGEFARDDVHRDKVGLGDWTVNPEKLPHGLGWLSAEAKRRGLRFGLWVEPEMVNTLSHLATSHPDWLLQEGMRRMVLGRGKTQTVLDLVNPAVRDNLFGQLDAVFATVPDLAYVKWDCNDHINNPGSKALPADRQPNLWFDYTVGLYDLLARLQAKRPEIMVQACASGGGHMDFGFLRYADEFWTSDDTDPLRRVFIQGGASQFYPAAAMARHVTASPNHQTKRKTPLKYRFDVAMTGRLGFELHPKDLTADEIAFAKRCVADYKRIRPLVQQGDLYRLASPYENDHAALMYVNEARTSAALFCLGLDRPLPEGTIVRIRPDGLDPDRTYVLSEMTRRDGVGHVSGPSAMSGCDLMDGGIPLALRGPYDSVCLELSIDFQSTKGTSK